MRVEVLLLPYSCGSWQQSTLLVSVSNSVDPASYRHLRTARGVTAERCDFAQPAAYC